MTVLIVDDERNIRESIGRLLELEGIQSEMATNGQEGVQRLGQRAFDAAILDLRMPVMDGQQLLEWIRAEGLRMPVIMISALGDITDAVRALKAGANDYLIKPFDPTELIIKVRALVASRKQQDLLEAGARTAESGARLIGESAGARAMRLLIGKVAPGDSTVLITGESGTGKEVVAREIHACSGRSEEPFVAVNIGAIHENLMESELFGHEKGAFTGAESRTTGLFELAGSGSLFLDEIGEMPLALQVKLLRVIQERRVRRLGGTHDIPVAARILSATNRDIESLVREGRFREDLYYRLNVVRIPVSPLRERREDIPLLAGHLLEKLRTRMRRPATRLSAEALEALSSYAFPGNIRELENILERAMITAEGESIVPADLQLPRDQPVAARHLSPARRPTPAPAAGTVKPIDEVERDAIVKALERWNGNRTRAAQDLGISRRTILNKIKRLGLD
jgi:DNA-binding NtrC family response regulator